MADAWKLSCHCSSAACPRPSLVFKFHEKQSRFPLHPPGHGRHQTPITCKAAPLGSTNAEDVIVVGGGIAGVAAGLALHKLGIKVRVLEQSPTLRVTGAALGVWTNGWHALESLGVANDLRGKFELLSGFQFDSTDGRRILDLDFARASTHVELRGVDRRVLLEILTSALPSDIISYDSRVTKVYRNEGSYPQVEMKDGSRLQAKVIVGCDGIGSVVARNLGLKEAHYAGYIGIRGVAVFSEGHTFPSVLRQIVGRGVRLGCLPLDTNRIYWFLVFNGPPDKKIVDPNLVKQEALRLVYGWPGLAMDIVKRSPVEGLSRSAISDRWMWPWALPKLHRCGVTVAGDAMHPVTPNLAQGGCTALEDGVVLARVLSRLFDSLEGQNLPINEEMKRVDLALEEYTTQRQRRMLAVAVQANLLGKVLQAEGALISSLRETLLPQVVSVDTFIEHTLYDVGVLA